MIGGRKKHGVVSLVVLGLKKLMENNEQLAKRRGIALGGRCAHSERRDFRGFLLIETFRPSTSRVTACQVRK
jgi:hypothetical protein